MIVITSKHLPLPTIPHSQGDCGPHTLYCSSLSSAESICSSAASKLRPSPSAVTLRLFVGDLAHTQGSSPLERREDGWRGLGRAKAPFRASASIWRNCRPKRSATTIRRNCDVVSNGSLAQTSNYFTLRAPQCGVRVAALVTAPCSGPAGQHGPRPPTPSSGLLRPPSRAPLCALNGCRPHPSGRRSNKDHFSSWRGGMSRVPLRLGLGLGSKLGLGLKLGLGSSRRPTPRLA